jgi:BirA family biotin operon repressor/biotin-[acetyl-CoA-carboxylase] ligase
VRLTPETEAAGFRVLGLDATQSTNDDAMRAAREGDPGRLWIVAREQKAGRGRHGREWASPVGNLYASLLLVDPCEPALAPQLGFVAGLALHRAVESVAGIGAPALALKWPNDLLLDGAKVSGLLLEGQQIRGGRVFALVIGFGVNVAFAPFGTPYPATSLRDAVGHVELDEVFTALADAFARAFSAWAHAHHTAPDPFAEVRAEWLARAAGRGSRVTIRLPSGGRDGIFEGLDPVGRLLLRTPAGLELMDAGDLYFPNLHKRSKQGPAR